MADCVKMIVLAAAFLLAVNSFFLDASRFRQRLETEKKKADEKKDIEFAAAELFENLNSSVLLDSDCIQDLVLENEDLDVKIWSESGKIGLNSFSGSFFATDYFSLIFGSELPSQILQKRKDEIPFFASAGEISRDYLNTTDFFTTDDFFNVNVSDMKQIESFLEMNGFDSKSLTARIISRQKSGDFIRNAVDLKFLLGKDFDILKDKLDFHPGLNLNFVTRQVLETLEAYYGKKIDVDGIESMQKMGRISSKKALELAGGHPAYEFIFGAKSSFIRAEISGRYTRLRLKYRRNFFTDDRNRIFTLVEKSWAE